MCVEQDSLSKVICREQMTMELFSHYLEGQKGKDIRRDSSNDLFFSK